MKGKKSSKLVMASLAASLLFSTGVPYNVKAESPLKVKTTEDVKKILSNLTKEQREALNKLDVKPYLTIAPDIDTKSSELVDIIVEFNQNPAKIEMLQQASKGKKMTLSNAKAKVEEEHAVFKRHIRSMKSEASEAQYENKDLKITREYKNAINGVAMTLPGVAIKDLVKSDVIKRIYKNSEVKIELPKTDYKPKMADSIPQIGVDKLHNENITGKGIKVGVLDTGIDYNHPDLANVYKGYRVKDGENPANVDPNSVKGWDFVNNDADPMETTYKEWVDSKRPEFNQNGNAYYTSHGTHVSGTIAAQKKNNVDYAVKGVAPDVDLYSYKVLGPYGSGATDGILAAIDKAIYDEMDVINLSLGSPTNDPLTPLSVAVNNAMLSGVVTVVSAGNSGPNEKTLGSPGTASLSISVGASDVSMNIPMFSGSVSTEKFENVQLLGKDFTDNVKELEGKAFPVVFAGLGKKADFDGKNLEGKIALLQRGELTFDEKIKNAKEAGAKIVLIYNNVEGAISSYLGEGVGSIPSFRMTKQDGERLKNLEDATFTFETLSNTKTEGDNLADFSSRGPVVGNDEIKPDVVAPGVAILSTVPEFINDKAEGVNYDFAYSRMQGTSMAAPHVTGTVALILQEHPNYSPFDVKSALMNTSDDLREEYSVYEVGSGRIDAYQAVHAETSVKVLDKTKNIDENGQIVEIDEETGSIGFGKMFQDTVSKSSSKKVEIKNNGKDGKTFDVSVEYHLASKGIQDAAKNDVTVTVPKTVTVDAGKSTEIKAEITMPSTAEVGRYEGYIHLKNQSDSSEIYQIPFSSALLEKGIGKVELNRPSVTNDTQFWEYMDPLIHGILQINSPLETIDVVVKEAKTGKPVGYLGTLDSSELLPDVEYFVMMLFSGYVYPFADDSSNPIEDIYMKLPAGDYVLEMIGQDEKGNSYSKGTTLVIDNKGPEIDFDRNGVIEVNDSMFTEEDGVKALWLHGSVKDETINLLQSKGYNYDQTTNILAYYENNSAFMRGFFPIKPNGDTKIGIEKSDYEKKPFKLTLLSSDIATATNSKILYFMNEGTEYTTTSYDKNSVKLKDSITMTLSLNNVKKLTSGNFDVTYDKNLYKFNNVKLTNEMKKYAKDKGLDIELKEPTITEESINNTVKVGATIKGKAFSGLDGDMPFLEVKFTLTDDKYYSKTNRFIVKNGNYMKAGQNTATAISDYSTNEFQVISTHSFVEGYIGPEAFMTSGGYLKGRDYTKIGAKVYVQSRSGKKYQGTIDKDGKYSIPNVPASDQINTIVIEVPGHLKAMQKFYPGYSIDGQNRGQWIYFSTIEGLAGDITGDKMIDIRDIQSVVDAYGMKDTSMVKEDINQDGIVNEEDVRYVERNFLTKGPDASANAKLKEKIGNKDIEYFLRLIGLELNK